MKTSLSIRLIVLLTILIPFAESCKKKDKEATIPPHNFLNQNMQGKLDGKPWTFVSGSKASLMGTNILFFTDTVSKYYDTCTFGGYGVHRLDLTTAAAIEPKLYAIGSGGFYGKFRVANTTVEYKDATGAIEITSVSNGLITGKIDARVNDDNYVNGNFTIRYCP